MRKREIVDTSEVLSGSISSEEVISVLEKTLVEFESAKSEEEQTNVINNFYKNIGDWEILLAHPAECKIWLQGPIRYFEAEREYSISERIKAFFSKGLLLKNKEVMKYADILSNTKFPVELTLTPVHSFLANTNEKSKFYYSVLLVLRNIRAILDKIDNKLAVYRKPAGIVAMNNTVFNINEMNKLSGNNMGKLKHTIETAPFSNLITQSEVGLITELGFEKYEDLERDDVNEERQLV